MKFKTLNSIKHRILLFGGIVSAVILLITFVITNSFAKYKTAQSMPLINGTVNYDASDLNAVAVYLQDEAASDGYAKANTIPTEGYILNEKMSYCAIGGARDDSITLSYDSSTQTLNVSPMTTKGTKCYLYFDEQASIKDTLLTYYPTILTRTDFSTTVENTTTGTIYKSADSTQYDDDGEVYYFAGNPTDNWVSFAGFYWRIIRVNGDGTLRLIYQGTSANTTGTGTQISTSAFNSSYGQSRYVGLVYGSETEQHGYGNNSTIMDTLNTWYQTNIQNTGYSSYIDTGAGFCSDRNLQSEGWSNTGNHDYAPYVRLSGNTPSLDCEDADILSVDNGRLTYPIGLITADEVMYGGIPNRNRNSSSNNSNYLYTGQNYWTMSPYSFYYGDPAAVYAVDSSGRLDGHCVNITNSVRPVINLKADTTISSGNGSSSSPFIFN